MFDHLTQAQIAALSEEEIQATYELALAEAGVSLPSPAPQVPETPFKPDAPVFCVPGVEVTDEADAKAACDFLTTLKSRVDRRYNWGLPSETSVVAPCSKQDVRYIKQYWWTQKAVDERGAALTAYEIRRKQAQADRDKWDKDEAARSDIMREIRAAVEEARCHIALLARLDAEFKRYLASPEATSRSPGPSSPRSIRSHRRTGRARSPNRRPFRCRNARRYRPTRAPSSRRSRRRSYDASRLLP